MVASSTPSATPVAFAKERMRPFTPSRNWVGPAAPAVSGGNTPACASVVPRKFTPGVCGADGASGDITAVLTAFTGALAARGESAGRARSRRGAVRRTAGRGAEAGAGVPGLVMMSATVRWKDPVSAAETPGAARATRARKYVGPVPAARRPLVEGIGAPC